MQINHFFLKFSEPETHSKYSLVIQMVKETGTLTYSFSFLQCWIRKTDTFCMMLFTFDNLKAVSNPYKSEQWAELEMQ